MASTIKIKRSGVSGKQPNTATLSVGELAINYKDQKLYSSNGTSVFEIGGASGGLVSTTTKTFDALKGSDTVITGVTAAVSTNYLQVVNASSTYATKAYVAANSYVKSTLANTNSYIATKVNSTTFNSALANTNSYIAAQATRITLVNTNLLATNTAIRALDTAKLSVANAVAIYQTRAIERAALANTNSYIAAQASRITLVNTNLTGTNTALRTLAATKLAVSNAAATYAPIASPTFTGTVTNYGQRIRISNASDPGIELSNGTTVKGYLFYDTSAADVVTLRHATTATGVSINSSGNVGIGTSSPQAKLVASNAGAAGLEFFTNYPGGGVGTYIQSYNRSGAAYVNTAYDALSHSFRTQSTERVVIDSSGNVGVGTSSPSTYGRLASVASSAFGAAVSAVSSQSSSAWARMDWKHTGVASEGLIYLDDSANFAIRNQNAGPISFYTNGGNERMRIDSSGNVGIGTATPGSKLDVTSTGQNIVISRSTGSYAAFGRIAPAGQQTYDFYTINGVEAGRITVDGSNYMSFSTGSSATERMRIDSSGIVNLYGGSGGAQLNMRNGGDLVIFDSTNTYGATIWSDPPATGMTASSYVHFDRWNSHSQRCGYDRGWDNYPSITVRNDTTNGPQTEFRIHGASGISGGDISVNLRVDGGFIGSTSYISFIYDGNDTAYYCDPNSVSRFVQLTHAGGTAYFQGGQGVDQCCGDDGAISIGGSSTKPPRIAWHSAGIMEGTIEGTNTGWRKIYFYDQQGAGLGVHATGQIASNQNVVAYYSDRRLKEDFEQVTDHWNVINNLTGYRFTWNQKSGEIPGFMNNVGKREVGLIAQEVNAVYPEAVYTRQEGPAEDPYKTILHDRFTPVFVEALKDLKREVELLKEENAKLRELIK